MTQPKTKIDLEGVEVDAAAVVTPPRELRDAWFYDDGSVAVDMEKARLIRISQLRQEAAEKAQFHADQAADKEWSGKDYAFDRQQAARFSGNVKRDELSRILNAQTAEDLIAITVEDLF